jgi:hypothetical protein
VGHILGKGVVRRKNDRVDSKARIADYVFDRSADVVDVIMRDEPIKVEHIDTRRLAQSEKRVKREGRFGHTAVVEDVVTVESEDKSVRLGNLGMCKANDAKHAVTESEIFWEDRGHFILFLSGRNQIEVIGKREKGKGVETFRGAKSNFNR